jgi:DNA-binding MarR family transcriptional regulator
LAGELHLDDGALVHGDIIVDPQLLDSVIYLAVASTPMDRGEELDAVERALERLLRLSASRNVHARRAAAAHVDVSQPGFVLLRRLQEDGPMSLGELAQMTDMDPAAAGRQVRQLEVRGLVATSTLPEDRRVTVVRVTPRGADARRRLAEVGGRHMEDVLGSWPSRDRVALARLLDRLVDDMRAVHYRTAEEERAG